MFCKYFSTPTGTIKNYSKYKDDNSTYRLNKYLVILRSTRYRLYIHRLLAEGGLIYKLYETEVTEKIRSGKMFILKELLIGSCMQHIYLPTFVFNEYIQLSSNICLLFKNWKCIYN